MPTQKELEKATHLDGASASRLPDLQENSPVTADVVRRDREVLSFWQETNQIMHVLGYTEHGQRHAAIVGHTAQKILSELGYLQRLGELANIAGLLHDIGNCIHRQNHALSGSLLAYQILSRLGMPVNEIITVLNAIGNHEEERGQAVTPIAAALVIADKADVHRSRVQNPDHAAFDIHDRVNYATTHSQIRVDSAAKTIALELEIDTASAQVIEYFEIFLGRMTMVRQAVQLLDCEFHLIVNSTRLS
jgi:hypothetical protein